MVLKKIQAAAAAYGRWLGDTRHHPYLYEWEAQGIFQDKWDIKAADFAQMYANALQNSETQRLWQVGNWQPKRVLTLLLKHFPETGKQMFDDLFGEDKEVAHRIGRFLFFCDELLSDYKKDHKTSIENNHYHDDYRMISMYLAFRYPDTYAIYNFEDFKSAMAYFESKKVPDINDPVRFFKVTKTLYTFLEKDATVLPNLQKHLNPKKHFSGKSYLVVSDFLRFIAQSK